MSAALEALEVEIDDFVAELLDGYEPTAARDRPKAIHDNVWGTLILDPWEVDLIDSPLLQRLRGIRQTGLSYDTFPSSSHSRFEHTIGCLGVANRMFDEIQERARPELRSEFITDLERLELRIAALLHDVGHGVFSHASELIASADPDVRQAIKDAGLQTTGAFEFFSYLIARSSAFGQLLAAVKERHKRRQPLLREVNQERIALLVVGRGDRERDYLAKMISGPFDCDKLDYIARDSRASGLEFLIDIPRLHYAVQLEWVIVDGENDRVVKDGSDSRARLSLLVSFSASSVLEQLLFAKTQLYVIVYHHQKARGAEALARQILSELMNMELLRSPVDLLRLSDDAFVRSTLPVCGQVHSFGEIIDKSLRRLAYRRLPHRVAVLEKPATFFDTGYVQDLAGAPDAYSLQQALARQIENQVSSNVDGGVLVDFPSSPSLDEASLALVRGPENSVYPLAEAFPVQGWLRSYAERKWRGHIYGPPSGSQRTTIFRAAQEVLRQYDVHLDSRAALLAHVVP